ncbi:MAG: OmpA family protein [Alphaproteobacteria bacterium]|nr:OmpA family protein [Alphaproteobacteria bacterium]
MADKNQPIIIIKRRKKGGHGGHHGGAWKVAYADFVTAMMAFFLMLWLLNVTTSDQRKGIADYFAPVSISRSEGGSGGVMAGMSISAPFGADISTAAPPGTEERAVATVGEGQEGDEQIPEKSEESANLEAKDQVTREAVNLAKAMREEEDRFQETESALMRRLFETPGMSDLAQQLIIDRTPEGLRIQIVDRDKFSMFPSGSSNPYQRGRDLLRLVGSVIAQLPNRISVTGHTDSRPFALGSRRDNWDLSTDRANVSRSELRAGGVTDDRIARVVGLADKDPFVIDNPEDPRNRRISIVLLRQVKQPQAAPAPK